MKKRSLKRLQESNWKQNSLPVDLVLLFLFFELITGKNLNHFMTFSAENFWELKTAGKVFQTRVLCLVQHFDLDWNISTTLLMSCHSVVHKLMSEQNFFFLRGRKVTQVSPSDQCLNLFCLNLTLTSRPVYCRRDQVFHWPQSVVEESQMTLSTNYTRHHKFISMVVTGH